VITIVLTFLTLAAALLGLALYRRHADPALAAGLESQFAAAIEADRNSQVSRMLLAASRPVSALPQVHLNPESSLYKSLRLKLAGANNMYGGSVEVFISVQILTALLSALMLVVAILCQLDGATLAAVALFAAAFTALPYNKLSEAVKKRQAEITEGLPEFAELLLMPVTSGYGILPALDFTSQRQDGPVASEVRLMLAMLNSRAQTEHEAFVNAGERLGTPAALTFFNTLYQAYTDGTKVADTLRGQAEQLRKQSYEDMRAKVKALPNKLVIIMGLHLLPFLFVVVLLPTIGALGQM
jgi:tight adherence protein C